MDIKLRRVQPCDINEEFCSWYRNDDGHLKYFSGSGRSFDREYLINDIEAGAEAGTLFYYLIQTEEGQAIGTVKIGHIDLRNKNSDLVCLIGNRDFTGMGLASKAIGLANKVAFEDHDIKRLQGGMYASNIGAIKAYTKAGWVVEATFKGFYLVDDIPEDRVCVACFNPRYFDE